MAEQQAALCGVILAAGSGSRLGYPNELGGKPMVRVAGKPLLEHSLCRLAAAGITDIAVVVNPTNLPVIEDFAGGGARFGAKLTYIVQPEPLGIAHALALCRDFAAGRHLALLLVDNLFAADICPYVRQYAAERPQAAQIFVLPVAEPQDYGVAVLQEGRIVRLVEKPREPVSDLAVIGLYFYPPQAFDLIPRLKPSARGELEITDLNNLFLQDGRLNFRQLDGWWLDVGNAERLAEAEKRLAAANK